VPARWPSRSCSRAPLRRRRRHLLLLLLRARPRTQSWRRAQLAPARGRHWSTQQQRRAAKQQPKQQVLAAELRQRARQRRLRKWRA
jgi:hypothetical protein